MNYKIVDLNQYERKQNFLFYKDFEDPFFNFTLDIDITSLVVYCKSNKRSLFLTKLYVFTAAANKISCFKQRLVEGEIREYHTIDPGSTILPKASTVFQFAYFKFDPDYQKFYAAAKAVLQREQAKKSFEPAEFRNDLIHYSSIPWIPFSSFKHARRFSFRESIPKIVFGKIKEIDKQKLIPVSIEVHHALMDAYHVSLFINEIAQILLEFK